MAGPRMTAAAAGRRESVMSRLTGKVAVVTGASKGIGAAIAKALAAEGASVVVNYASSRAGAEAVVAAITADGGQAVAVGGDVSKAEDARRIVETAIERYGHLDVLVNNSGVYEFAPIEAVTEEQFHRVFNVNVLGALLTRFDLQRKGDDYGYGAYTYYSYGKKAA